MGSQFDPATDYFIVMQIDKRINRLILRLFVSLFLKNRKQMKTNHFSIQNNEEIDKTNICFYVPMLDKYSSIFKIQ